MKIVLVSQGYSTGMGYTENVLPRVWTRMGHTVYVVTSTLQVYGETEEYSKSYASFLGPPNVPPGIQSVEGVTVLRLPFSKSGKYVYINGLMGAIARIKPDIVQCGNSASIDAIDVSIRSIGRPGRVFTECHQHSSIAWRPARRGPRRWAGQAYYRLSRSLPAWLAHLNVEKCFAIAPDCLDVARRLYWVPRRKLVLLPLGTDTDTFRPVQGSSDESSRLAIRERLGIGRHEVLAVYTGRFSRAKNPALLARTVAMLREEGLPVRGLFIGGGEEAQKIRECPGCVSIEFMKHENLADYYRASDIAVWPKQESMSMLDAAACGIPVVVSDRMGEPSRVVGSGKTYSEGDVMSLGRAIRELASDEVRHEFGRRGREKMVKSFSWRKHAEERLVYYKKAVEKA